MVKKSKKHGQKHSSTHVPAKVSTKINSELSSDSTEIMMANAKKVTCSDDPFFYDIRIGKQSGSSRPCSSYPEAYITCLRYIKHKQTELSVDCSFKIYTGDNKLVTHISVQRTGEMTFFKKEGLKSSYRSTIDKELSIWESPEDNSMNIEAESPTTITPDVAEVAPKDSEKLEVDETIKKNAQAFIERGMLTTDQLLFLSLKKDAATALANKIQEAVMQNCKLPNEDFVKVIQTVAQNMICITKQLSQGKFTDNSHVSLHDDTLYEMTHCRNPKYLFDGSNMWRRTPGKIRTDKMAMEISRMYDKGREILLNVASLQESTPIQEDTISEKNVVLKDTTAIKEALIDAFDFVDAITATIMVHSLQSADIQKYLQICNRTLDTEIETISKGLLYSKSDGASIEIGIKGRTGMILITSKYSSNEELRKAIIDTVCQLLIVAFIPEDTRMLVTSIIDTTSVVEMFQRVFIPKQELLLAA